METRFKTLGVNEEDISVSVYCNYLNLREAKRAFQEKKDDSVVIEIIKDKEERIGAICIGIEEAERIALALLNIRSSIKY
ncbi:hypothetical protein [Bacillus sp. es.036]|uniref:hypothetical protein n=1 Tax=Bacillus sp. es.036 TaxID=1761764 RepID=UPI000BF4478D|nr:hypothetical protein [Bacillus sp. es.036]PFG03023.1 hypothetical protein ATG70_4252 [Bacillus sp. es.036]